MSKKYNVIIFDWDGTIVNSTGLIVSAIKDAAICKGISFSDERKLYSVIGLSLDLAFRKLFDTLSNQEIIELQDLYKETYLKKANNISLFDGIDSGIKDLQRRGYSLAIATGMSRKGLDRALKQSGLNSFFPVTKTIDECFSKPHPQMIEEILDYYMISPDKALLVGDSTHDLKMAINSGIDSIGVTYGSEAPQELIKYKPKILANNTFEIFEWIMRNE